MNKEFVPYELALRMKQLGFDEPCMYYVDEQNNSFIYNFQTHPDEFIEWCGVTVISTPLYQQAFRWFREKHKMKFHIKEDTWNHWCAPLILIPETRDFEELCDWFETYEEAELACLTKLIEIVEHSKSE